MNALTRLAAIRRKPKESDLEKWHRIQANRPQLADLMRKEKAHARFIIDWQEAFNTDFKTVKFVED